MLSGSNPGKVFVCQDRAHCPVGELSYSLCWKPGSLILPNDRAVGLGDGSEEPCSLHHVEALGRSAVAIGLSLLPCQQNYYTLFQRAHNI